MISMARSELIGLLNEQSRLDQDIKSNHPEPEDRWITAKRIALLTEVGEMANEWRGFKLWSNDRNPRREKLLPGTYQDENGKWKQYTKDPLLEEYVDCIHFILSIGNDLMVKESLPDFLHARSQYAYTDDLMIYIEYTFHAAWFIDLDRSAWIRTFEHFLRLGELLGFTGADIVRAYFKKNETNHRRQSEGY